MTQPVTDEPVDQAYPAALLPVEQVTLPIAELVEHPDNPRRGDVAEIVESIKQHGFYGRILVQKSTMRILVGNHRTRAARKVGLTELPVDLVDIDDDEAARVLAHDNRSNEKGSFDLATLGDLLGRLAVTADGLVGTGYTDDDLADIDALMEAAQPGPDDVEPDTIHKHFNNEAEHTSNRRVFVFDLAMPTFEWADRQLRIAAKEMGLETNTDVFLRLLADATGTRPPVLK